MVYVSHAHIILASIVTPTHVKVVNVSVTKSLFYLEVVRIAHMDRHQILQGQFVSAPLGVTLMAVHVQILTTIQLTIIINLMFHNSLIQYAHPMK